MTTILAPTGELILPPGIERIQEPDEPDEPAPSDPGTAAMLPEPVGFKLLCAVPEMSEQFEDSVLIKSTKTMNEDAAATAVLFVLAIGPDAYKDPSRFPSGPWCKVGDWVVVRTYTGTRFKVFGKEFRVIHDDQVEAIVADPRGVVRFNA